VADGLLAVIMTFLSAYFFIVERDSILQKMSRIMPSAVKKHVDMIANSFVRAVGGYFKAQLKLAVIVFVILYIGFKLIGVKYACLLGIVVAFLDLLPVFGTGFVIWPWALVDVITGEYMEMAALIVIYIICQLVKQLLQPKMVGDSIGMKPLPTLIFLYCGYKIGGFVGMLIGIPVGMVIMNFYQAGAFDVLIEDGKNVAKDLVENYWE
jgi:sporulation integral membrane protein YtvI